MSYRPFMVAGPCSAESEQQVMDCALALKHAGIDIFRAGLWKPRTSPDTFAGVGAQGLAWLKRVQSETDIKVATEIATAEHLLLCLDNDITHLWIGARTCANPFMLQQIAEAIKLSGRAAELCVMVKNPIHPDLAAWLGAIERLQQAGVGRIMAVHRGFSDSVSSSVESRNNGMRNDPLWSIPLSLKRRMPHLPILCDPSHLSGDRYLVARISQQALDLGMDGLMIEVHPVPEKALSDAKQQITPDEFKVLVDSLHLPSAQNHEFTALQALRNEIDRIDSSIWNLIEERLEVAKQIGDIKHKAGMPVYQNQRYSQLLQARLSWAQNVGLEEKPVRQIIEAIHELAISKQLK